MNDQSNETTNPQEVSQASPFVEAALASIRNQKPDDAQFKFVSAKIMLERIEPDQYRESIPQFRTVRSIDPRLFNIPEHKHADWHSLSLIAVASGDIQKLLDFIAEFGFKGDDDAN